MKVAFSILATAALAAAQSNPINSIPDCAKNCVGQFMSGSSIAGCSLLDYKCVCSNKDFIGQIACCLAPVCDDAGKQATLELAGKLCKAYGVDLPTVVACTTGASSTSAAASTGSSSSATSATSSATSSASSSASGTASAQSTGTSTTSAASSGAATATGSKTTGAASSSATSTSKPAAAPTNAAGLVGAIAALAFAL